MIAFIKGKIAAYGADWIVVDNNGIGWKIFYPHTDTVRVDQEVTIHTYMHITENDMSLFGFESQNEQELFIKLIGVKGLGPKTGISILARTNMERLIASIEEGDVSTLKTIPGIGAKTASQIILDLKGKLISTAEKSNENYSAEIMDAMDGLKALGYKQGDINSAAKVMNEQPGKTSSEYLRIGLRALSKLGG